MNGSVWLKGLENEILSETPGMSYKCSIRYMVLMDSVL